MTTREAEASYEARHVREFGGRPKVVFNPHNRPVEGLPVIYGFNNGGRPGMLSAALVAEDGTRLGDHCCSSEAYMPADLGVIEGGYAERHVRFRKHYPDGYRMEFVSYHDVQSTPGLVAALALLAELAKGGAT